ncbi:putative carboxypeptidase [Auriculariales sp. MPI-PUGE-AT-0066]|nr:putative carboxypeptidase [Auriculariales sp. MPI-PUGE-AT-0066]
MHLPATLPPLLATILSAYALSSRANSLAAPHAGVKVLRIPTGPSASVLTELETLIESLSLSKWTTVPRINSHIDVEVPASKYEQFKSSIDPILAASGASEHGWGIKVMHEDLGASIAAESEGVFKGAVNFAATPDTDTWFDEYHSYDDHLAFLNNLVKAHPNNAEIVTSGTSFEGRNITGIHIFGAGGKGAGKAVIWHGTVHAREWITTMVVEYMAYQLLNDYANSTEVAGFVDSMDFYVFPFVNPDGFVYTQTTERLWRKNRQTAPLQSTCAGRDINRNWNTSWAQATGASTDPCAQDFKGLAPADAPETKALQEFVNKLASSEPGALMYSDWHSYSQLFMTPYGYTCDQLPPDNDELTSLAAGFADAVRQVYGTEFTSGPICPTIYPASGSSTDYAYIESKVKYSFAAELRDQGEYGFVLPPAQIRPAAEETWAGVKYILTKIQPPAPEPKTGATTDSGSPSGSTPSGSAVLLSSHFAVVLFATCFALLL